MITDATASDASVLFFQRTTMGSTLMSRPAIHCLGRAGSIANAVASPTIDTEPLTTRSATSFLRTPPVTINGMRAISPIFSANSRK
ncbi:hypothetical protein D3C81_1239120 [compost metagenome]